MASRGLDALQDLGEARERIVALEEIVSEQSANLNALESHELELLDENRHLEHKLLMTKI